MAYYCMTPSGSKLLHVKSSECKKQWVAILHYAKYLTVHSCGRSMQVCLVQAQCVINRISSTAEQNFTNP